MWNHSKLVEQVGDQQYQLKLMFDISMKDNEKVDK